MIQASKLTIYPLSGDNRLDNVSISWDLTLFIEREKTFRFGKADYIAPDPNTPTTLLRKSLGIPCTADEPCYVDPFHVTSDTETNCPGTKGACGKVVRHVWTYEMNCYQQHVIDYDFHGTRRESIFITYSYPGDEATLGELADMHITAEYHLVDDLVEFWGTSEGLQEHYVYQYGAIESRLARRKY